MEQTYKGKKYVGFKVVDYLNGKENTTSDNDYITGTWRGKRYLLNQAGMDIYGQRKKCGTFLLEEKSVFMDLKAKKAVLME